MLLRRIVTGPARRGGRALGSHLRWAPTRALRRWAGARDHLADGRHVALTFDDGPDPDFTPAVLDALAREGASATFFVVGRRARQHPELVRRIRGEGHVLGSHSLTHPDARRLQPRQLRAEYAQGRAALEEVLGMRNSLFRPPNGTLDLTGASTIRRLGLVPWLWNVDPEDWHPDATEDRIVERCRAARAGDVVLLHDGLERPLAPRALDRSATVRAVPRIIGELRAAGCTLGPLPAC